MTCATSLWCVMLHEHIREDHFEAFAVETDLQHRSSLRKWENSHRHVRAQAVGDFALISLYLNNRCCVQRCGRRISIPLNRSCLPNVSKRSASGTGSQRSIWLTVNATDMHSCMTKMERLQGRTCKTQAEMKQQVWTQDHLPVRRNWATHGLISGGRIRDVMSEDVVGIRTEKAMNPFSLS